MPRTPSGRWIVWLGFSALPVLLTVTSLLLWVASQDDPTRNESPFDAAFRTATAQERDRVSFNSLVWATAPPPFASAQPTYLPTPADEGGNLVLSTYSLQPTPPNRQVIQSAQLSITAEDPAQTITQITSLADNLDGWVVSASLESFLERDGVTYKRGLIRLRIPTDQMPDALTQIRSLATSINSEQLSGEDVTTTRLDLNSRLAILQTAESQLQSILENAETTQDVLDTFRELVTIRSEIERLTASLEMLQNAVAYASLQVEIQPSIPPSTADSPTADWNPRHTLQNAAGSALRTAQRGLDALIYLLVYGMLGLALLALPGLIVWWLLRRP